MSPLSSAAATRAFVGNGTIIDVVIFASACTTNISFSGLFATGVTHGVFGGTVAHKVPWLEHSSVKDAEINRK